MLAGVRGGCSDVMGAGGFSQGAGTHGEQGETRMHRLLGARYVSCSTRTGEIAGSAGMMGGYYSHGGIGSMMSSGDWRWMRGCTWQHMARQDWQRRERQLVGSGAGTLRCERHSRRCQYDGVLCLARQTESTSRARAIALQPRHRRGPPMNSSGRSHGRRRPAMTFRSSPHRVLMAMGMTSIRDRGLVQPLGPTPWILLVLAIVGGSAGAGEDGDGSPTIPSVSRTLPLAHRREQQAQIISHCCIPPAGLEPAISCVKGRRPDR